MGILDDAIREHLELKRKHGAAEDEVQRQEEEALGPARREVAGAEARDEDGTTEGAEAEAVATVEGADGGEPEEPMEPAAVVAPAEPPEAADSGEPEPVDSTADEDAPLLGDDTPPAGFEAVHDDEPSHQEAPRGDERPEEEGEDAPPGDPDLLEDTPDFLQETPEHDRLWFEQKPPRDFDFD